MDIQIESTLAKYLEFKVFELFKSRTINTIAPHCRQGSKEDVYKHLFLAPAQLSKKRNFQLHGVLSPFVCLWRTSLLEWNKDLYARSVLYRDFKYTDIDGQMRYERGFLYDIQITFELFSSSYYRDFRDRINQDLIDLDRLRYFDFDLKELFVKCDGLITRAEVMLDDIKPTDNIDPNQNRSFDLNARYTVKMSVPYCKNFDYLNGIEVYLNENKIYERKADIVEENK